MAFIEWNDSLKLGVKIVDQQHERLIGIINRLHEAAVHGRGGDVVAEILDELIIYTATHFSTEEKHFAQIDYSNREEHKQEHDALMAKVSAMIDELQQSPPQRRNELVKELLEFLRIWWRYHMLDTDAKFVAEFKRHGLS